MRTEDKRSNDEEKIGASVATVDFGPGYSNPTYLKRFQADVAKMGRSVFHDMPNADTDTEVVKTIVGLGNSLNTKPVADGVEMEDLYNALCGISGGPRQRHYLCKPMAYDDVLYQPEEQATGNHHGGVPSRYIAFI